MKQHVQDLIDQCVDYRLKAIQMKKKETRIKYHKLWTSIFNQLPSKYITEYSQAYFKRVNSI